MSNPTKPRPGREAESLEAEHLSETRERLEIALQASGMGVFDLDLTTMSARTSLRHNEIFGYAEAVEEWSPAIFTEHVLPEDRPLIQPALDRALEGADFDLTVRVRWPDGSIHWMRDWGRVYRDAAGRPVRLVGVTEDVTDAMVAEEELRRSKEEAEEAVAARGRMLAVMSHELRTPLTGIIGSADILEIDLGDGASPRARAAVTRIQATAWHMATLIDDLLALARSEAGKEEVRLRDTDVSKLIRDVSAILETQVEAKGLKLRVEGVDLPATLRTDAGKVRQIVMNLAGNAIKYTAEGEVVVTISRVESGGVEVSIRDTGPGVPPDAHEVIFEPFSRLECSGAHGGAGTGLGLAIARRLARMLGGSVEVESEVGVGSTFTLRLPAAPAA